MAIFSDSATCQKVIHVSFYWQWNVAKIKTNAQVGLGYLTVVSLGDLNSIYLNILLPITNLCTCILH